MKLLFFCTIFSFCLSLSAGELRHGFTDSQITEMSKHNSFVSTLSKNLKKGSKPSSLIKNIKVKGEWLPYAEYNDAGYLIINSAYQFDSQHIKEGLLKNLPSGVKVVVYTGSELKSNVEDIFARFSEHISPDRLKVISLPRGDRGFWARDGVPVPLVPAKSGQGPLAVVDAKYYHTFEADKEIADLFGANLAQHSYYYEGGNFMASAKGDCIMVDNQQASKMPDSIFSDFYGCKSLTRLPHIKGIGHADESVKFVSDDTVLTDDEGYAKTLQSKGFKVLMLPRPQSELETYVNSLIVNGTVYLPVFNQETDEDAIKTYKNLGLKVVPLNSTVLSNDGAGSIHCITMTYPPVPFNELLANLKAKELK